MVWRRADLQGLHVGAAGTERLVGDDEQADDQQAEQRSGDEPRQSIGKHIHCAIIAGAPKSAQAIQAGKINLTSSVVEAVPSASVTVAIPRLRGEPRGAEHRRRRLRQRGVGAGAAATGPGSPPHRVWPATCPPRWRSPTSPRHRPTRPPRSSRTTTSTRTGWCRSTPSSNPRCRSRHRDLLIDVAAAGDFATYRDRRAARASMTLSRLAEAETTCSYSEFTDQLYTETLLPQLMSIALDNDRYRDLWAEEDDRADGQRGGDRLRSGSGSTERPGARPGGRDDRRGSAGARRSPLRRRELRRSAPDGDQQRHRPIPPADPPRTPLPLRRPLRDVGAVPVTDDAAEGRHAAARRTADGTSKAGPSPGPPAHPAISPQSSPTTASRPSPPRSCSA